MGFLFWNAGWKDIRMFPMVIPAAGRMTLHFLLEPFCIFQIFYNELRI